ncbi:putative serine/threonine protein kinase [Babesia divergens]|uniref:non-specific serine/threonine protein kinase n=1 Tax=Babesia divergens TaxID=32595 RepID=A0AAD9GCW0_BABDI|nr:putative serine/threonine protein kinase [Babesia divergens]
MEAPYQSAESSDSDDSTLERRHRTDRTKHVLRSNLFFSTTSDDDKEAIRSTQIYKRNHYEKGLTKDKRTTVQQVLDKRTYIRLRKLCGQGVFHYMHGVISTGKEANVFEAETLPPAKIAELRNEDIAFKGAVEELVDKIQTAALSNVPEINMTSSADTTNSDTPGEIPHPTENNSNGKVCESENGKDSCEMNAESSEEGCSRVAIKVYKTSILVFKDRSRYIEGEFRFRRAYVGTKNPRKMVAQWAEKEFRNLRRIALSGLYSPAPIALKDHILVMDIILNNDNVAPKLESLGALKLIEWQTIYVQTICSMRILFQECKLIHGDLSSFNMLYSEGRVFVIDTSQALENDHLNAMPFLKRDCENVTKFFETVNVIQNNPNENLMPYDTLKMLTSQQLFCFVVARNVDVGDLNPIGNGEELVPQLPKDLWEDETLNHVRRFWNFDERKIQQEVVDCLEKMTKFNKFGTSMDVRDIITKKRLAYLGLCKTLYNFLTGPIFANEEYWKQVQWLREVDFDKVLPLNMSQIPLDVAESVLEHSQNVVMVINALSDDGLAESDANDDEADDSLGTEPDEEVNSKEKEHQTPKFTGKIPEGIDPREWKKMVKEHNRERRKHKIPKHIKKKYGSSKS